MDTRQTADILAENKRLNEQITANNVELQRRRWQSGSEKPIRIEDFVGKRACVTEAFREWINTTFTPYSADVIMLRLGETVRVMHVNPTEGDTFEVDVEIAPGHVMRGVPFDIAQDMRRAYMETHGEG